MMATCQVHCGTHFDAHIVASCAHSAAVQYCEKYLNGAEILGGGEIETDTCVRFKAVLEYDKEKRPVRLSDWIYVLS